MFLSFLGVTLTNALITWIGWLAPKVSIYLVWAAPAVTVIGGGAGVAVALLFAYTGDVVSQENKVNAFAQVKAPPSGHQSVCFRIYLLFMRLTKP